VGRKTTAQLNQYVRFEFCLWFILPGGWTDIMALCVGGPRRIINITFLLMLFLFWGCWPG